MSVDPAPPGPPVDTVDDAAAPRITLEMLEELVPLVQAAAAARTQLDGASEKARAALIERIRDGESAREALVTAFQPYLRSIAASEFQRRARWSSRVTREDLLQEANASLLRTLMAWKPGRSANNPTAYFSIMIAKDVKRAVELLDHDFTVPTDVADRARRVVAIATRLDTNPEAPRANAETIAAASSDFGYRGLSTEQVHDIQQLRHRMFQADPLRLPSEVTAEQRPDASLTSEETPEEVVLPGIEREVQAELIGAVFGELGMPELQCDIVRRFFGLPPHLVEESMRGIARILGVRRDTIGSVIEAFQAEMARPHGPFHRLCAGYSGDLEACGLGWVLATLGEFDPAQASDQIAAVLTAPLRAAVTVPPAPAPPTFGGVVAQFCCPFHGRVFAGHYAGERDVPPDRDCPSCGAASPRVGEMNQAASR